MAPFITLSEVLAGAKAAPTPPRAWAPWAPRGFRGGAGCATGRGPRAPARGRRGDLLVSPARAALASGIAVSPALAPAEGVDGTDRGPAGRGPRFRGAGGHGLPLQVGHQWVSFGVKHERVRWKRGSSYSCQALASGYRVDEVRRPLLVWR